MQFSPRELQLLTAAVNPDPVAAAVAWGRWSSQISLEEAPYPERRLLCTVYGHLSLIAPTVDLPRKLRGKARATFASNHLLASETLRLRESLSAISPVILSDAIATCLRFEAWATRDVRTADIHVAASALQDLGTVLSSAGWHFQSDDILQALADPRASSFSSLSVTRERALVRIHWRLAAERSDGPLTRGLWADAEDVKYLGRPVGIQSTEDSLLDILYGPFRGDDRSEALLAVVDAARLLRVCRPERLNSRLATASLSGSFHELIAMLQEIGIPQDVVSRITPRSISPASDYAAAASAEGRRSHARRRTAAANGAMARKAPHYLLWHVLGRRARVERILLRLGGPFSNMPPKLEQGQDRVDTDGGFGHIGHADGSVRSDRLRIMQDPADIRMLVPLPSMGDHTVVIEFAADDMFATGHSINAFANGRYLATVNRGDLVRDSQYRFFVPSDVLFGCWVELSLRTKRVDAKRRNRTSSDLADLLVQRLHVLTSDLETPLAACAPSRSAEC